MPRCSGTSISNMNKTFLHFLVGFVAILGASFAVLLIASGASGY